MQAMRDRIMDGRMPGMPMQPGPMHGGQMPDGRPLPGAGMPAMPGVGSGFPEHADQQVRLLTARLETARAIAAAGHAPYAVLADAQKKIADELLTLQLRGM